MDVNPNDEHILEGGGRTHVTRSGDVVFRESQPWTPFVHLVLRHLEECGFEAAPRVLGVDERGREMVRHINGEFVHPGPWSDEGLWAVGTMLRELHDAMASFRAPADAVWQPWFLRELGDGARVIGHGDAAPWNTVTRDGLPVGLIDWEYAGPVDPLTELARVCWLFPQLHDDDVAERVGLPPLAVRAGQLRLVVDAYGLTASQRKGMFQRILDVTVCETAANAIEERVTPESHGALWGLAWRARAAGWMVRNRRELERALG